MKQEQQYNSAMATQSDIILKMGVLLEAKEEKE